MFWRNWTLSAFGFSKRVNVCYYCFNMRLRRFLLLILFVLLLPPLELIRRYHEEIWEYCPNTHFYNWGTESFLKSKCEIPQLNLWDPTIMQYIKNETTFKECATDYPLVRMTWALDRPQTPSRLDLTDRGRKELHHLNCIYQQVTRNSDDKTLTYGPEVEAKFPMNMPYEVIQVVCREKSNKTVFYTDSFGTIVPLRISRNNSSWKKKWNVMIIGIDSVSRQSFIRFLPKSFDWLKRKQNDGVFIFDSYSKIGENTFPNLVPFLTGRKVELSSPDETLQLPHSGSFYTWVLGLPFDDFPFVWKDYKKAGYVTGFVEDDPNIATFNLMRRGFKEQPTDHYGRPLFLAFDTYKDKETDVNPSLTRLNETSGQWYTIESHYFCINGRKKYELLWDYGIRQFTARYAGVAPTFMLTWVVQLTHEWLTTLKQADLPLLDTLRFLTGEEEASSANAPWKENTFVILFSDHGQRVDKIRSSFVGRLEDRLPFLAISVPPAFRKKFPKMTKNIGENTKRLVTVLDLYATLKHILHLDSEDARDEPEAFTDLGPSGFAKSLFQSVSTMRSCIDAGIPEWYCPCHRYTVVNTTSKEAVAAGTAMAKAIAASLVEAAPLGLCANLTLARIDSIRKVEFTTSARRYTTKCRFFGIIKEAGDVEDIFDEYIVQITMTPGNGKFEANVRNYWRAGAGWKLIGAVERVNRYGNQSACVPDSLERLRKSCYCTSNLKT